MSKVPQGKATDKSESFGDKMERLDGILRRLENRNLPLDESLEIFESGVSLVKEARAYLEEAEQRVTLLTREGEETAFKDKLRLAE